MVLISTERDSSRLRRALRSLAAALVVTLCGVVLAPMSASADNLTVSGDVARTGWDPDEPALSPSAVSAADFGRIFDRALDGSVYAQPLVIGSTVVVSTEKATVYGLDAATGAVRWTRNDLGAPFQSSSIGCGDLTPDLGQTSTGVYDPATDSVYLTSKIADGPSLREPHWYLHALDPATGQERAGYPFVLQGTADNDPTVTFDPFTSLQRAGLLLAGGVVYLGFGSHCDIGAWRGWVMGVRVGAQPRMQTVFTTEAGAGGGAGVWQAGGGLMSDGVDASGNPRIFFATGNGLSPPVGPGSPAPAFLGDSVVRASLDGSGRLVARDFFAPSNVEALDRDDADFGSGGPVALPASFGTPAHPRVLFQVGKDGRVFLLDRDRLGGRAQGAGGSDAVVAKLGPFGGVWGHPAVYPGEGGWVYSVDNAGPMRAFARSMDGAGNPTLSMAGTSAETFGYTSGSPVVTSDGTAPGSALVWVVRSDGPTGANARLSAYDALPTGGRLQLRWSAPIGTASKFAMPATTGGRVFVGTRDGHMMGFGRPSTSVLTGQPADLGLTEVGTTSQGVARLTATRALTVTGVGTTAPFSLTAPALPIDLAAGQVLDVPVALTPTRTGAVAAVLSVQTSAGPAAVDLRGSGTRTGLAAMPSALTFGTVPTGLPKTLTVTIANTGTTAETITGVDLPNAPFSVTGAPSLGSVVPAQQSVGISVAYAPTEAGTHASSLTVRTTTGIASVPLTGTAQSGQGRLTITPTTTDFGAVTMGSSVTRTFDITNTGNVAVTVTLAKAPAGAFSAQSPLAEGVSIGPGDVVHQRVTFTPASLGRVSAGYELTADDGRGKQMASLTGVGVTGVTAAPVDGPGWTRNGAATAAGGEAVLTPAMVNVAGSTFLDTSVPSDGLDVRFISVIGPGTGADGLAFALLDAASPSASLGASGQGLGLPSAPAALAVVLDTYQNDGDPSANFVAVATSPLAAVPRAYLGSSTAVPNLQGEHDVHAHVDGGRLQVSVDGQPTIDLPVSLPLMVRPGFTAGTGGAADRHAVRGVRLVSRAPNTAPTATWASVSTPLGTPVALPLTGTDPQGDPLSVQVVTGPAHGWLSGTAPTLTYQPDAGYLGGDVVRFTVTDDQGAVSAEASVDITMTPVPDPPGVPPAPVPPAPVTSAPVTSAPGAPAPAAPMATPPPGLAADPPPLPPAVTLPTTPAPMVATSVGSADIRPPATAVEAPTRFTLGPWWTVRWRSTDAGSGVATHDVRYRTSSDVTGLGAWRYPAARTLTTATTMSLRMTPGTEYCVSVRARDRAGNLAAWSPAVCTSAPLDDRAFGAASGWGPLADRQAYGGTVRRAVRDRATLSRVVLMRRLAVVATTCAACGKVSVYENGALVRTLDLRSARTRHRVLLAVVSHSASRRVRITLVVRGSGRPVLLDAIATGTV